VKTKISIIVILLVFAFSNPLLADIVIVAHSDINKEFLTKTNIQKIYRGNKSSLPTNKSDNVKMRLVLLNDENKLKEFTKELLNMDTSEFRRIWKTMLFTGRGLQPLKLPTQQEVVDFVRKTKGTIGFVTKEDLTELDVTNIHVIVID